MAKKINYDEWSKEELVKEIKRLRETTYGLVWHRDVPQEKIDVLINPDARTPNEMFPNQMAGKPFPVLKEVKAKEVRTDKTKPINLLIEGDNFHSLAVLNFTHQESIDLIYIDPPYNTGNKDFIYNDMFKSGYLEKEDPFKHSKWLAFIEKRLRLAKHLLNKDGLIFISIDDNEQAPLKMLADEIFGENNLVSLIVWKNKYGPGAMTKGFGNVHEYILCYSKTPLQDISAPLTDEEIKKYKLKDKNFSKRGGYITQPLATRSKDDRPNLVYPIIYNNEEIWPDKQWIWSEERMKTAIKNDEVVFKKTGDEWSVRFKQYLYDKDGIIRRAKPISLLNGPFNQDGTREIENIFGKKVFNNPKPVKLIKYLLSLSVNGKDSKDSVVLDFMAGSGTTAQAVMELNKEDQGNRKFILCTNNENNICTDVCYPRIKAIIKGYKNIKGEKIEGLGGNLRYFKCDFVEAESTDRNKRKLVNESTEMLCIKEDAFHLVVDDSEFKIFKNSENKYLGIVFYEDAIEEYKKAIRKIDGHFNTYVFSLGDDPHEKEFKDVKNKVTLCAIPEVILKVYREIFK